LIPQNVALAQLRLKLRHMVFVLLDL
jgi:hypothetical protein